MKKVVLITGASSGMGKETAKLLAQKGYVVYASARREDKMNDLIPLGVNTIYMDVTDDHSMVNAVHKIVAKENRIDVLVNNAGFGTYGAIEDVPMEQAKYQLEVNLFGTARLTQLVLPHMRKQKFGKIVNISSIGGKFATPFGGWYHASKFALEALSDSLRNEVKQFGIDVIVIEPGGVKTEWGNIAFESLKKNVENSAYKELATKFANAFTKTLDKNAESIVIAEIIKKSIESSNPKTRYIGGYMAKAGIIARKLLSDKMLDKMIMSQAK